MIAEYRRILKDPAQERRKKCTFFEALHKIHQAKDANGVRAALDNYEEDQHADLIEFNNFDENQENYMANLNSETSDLEDKEIFSYQMSPSHLNPIGQFGQIGQVQVNGFNHQVVQLNNGSRNRTPTSFLTGQSLNASLNSNGDLINQAIAIQRLKQAASQQNSQTNSLNGDHYYSDNLSDNSGDQFPTNYQLANNNNNVNHSTSRHNNVNSNNNNTGKHARSMNDYPQKSKKHRSDDYNNHQLFDNSLQQLNSSTTDTAELLIDKMFEHFAKGTEAMREWIKLEERRLEQDIIRKQEERAREERREKKYLEAFVKMQNQMFEFLAKQNNQNLITEARNLNLVDNLKDELNSANRDDHADKDVQQQQQATTSTSQDKIVDEDKSSNKSDGTVSASEESDLAIEQLDQLIDTNNNQLSQTDETTVKQSLEQTAFVQTTIKQPATEETLIETPATDHQPPETLQTSKQTVNTKHSDYVSLLTKTKQRPQQNTNINEEIVNQHLPAVVDLQYVYKDEVVDNECNNYHFTNVQHEEIVN